MADTRTAAEALARDERGAVALEYLVASAVAFVIVAGLFVLGAGMVAAYGRSLQLLYGELP